MEHNPNQQFETRPLGKALQARTLVGAPSLPETHQELFKSIRSLLIQASSCGALKTPQHEIHKLLQLESQSKKGPFLVYGGGREPGGGSTRNHARDQSIPHFERYDGGWFDFAITVAVGESERLELHSYAFELRFAEGDGSPHWLRFDLNPPDAKAADKELRAHVHPGHDDLRAPSPLMNPDEVLELLIYGLKR